MHNTYCRCWRNSKKSISRSIRPTPSIASSRPCSRRAIVPTTKQTTKSITHMEQHRMCNKKKHHDVVRSNDKMQSLGPSRHRIIIYELPQKIYLYMEYIFIYLNHKYMYIWCPKRILPVCHALSHDMVSIANNWAIEAITTSLPWTTT